MPAKRATPERRYELDLRIANRRARTPGFTPMHRKPKGHVSKDWDPRGEKVLAK